MPKPTLFLSYRRQTSDDLAQYLSEKLRVNGVDVFFDRQTLSSGRFASVIEREIINREHFLVILTPQTLESEWVRREIQTALRHHKNIIPLLDRGFSFSNMELPSEIAGLREFNGVKYERDYAEASFQKILRGIGQTPTTPPAKTSVPKKGLSDGVKVAIIGGIFAVIAAVIGILPNLIQAAPTSIPSTVTTMPTATTSATETPIPNTEQPTSVPTDNVLPEFALTATALGANRVVITPPTVMPVQATTVVKGYPCDGTILFTTGAMLDQVKVLPQKNSPKRPPIQQGQAIQILAQQNNDGLSWYQISYNENTTGWIPASSVESGNNCPVIKQ